jgi:hypothetical protein
VISTGIQRYLYVVVREQAEFVEHRYRINWSTTGAASVSSVTVLSADRVRLSLSQALQVGVIKLSQGCSIRGRIKWETPPLVPTTLVQLTDGEGTVQRDGIQVIRGSRFTFDGLRPGLYRVRVRSGLQVGWVESDPVQVVAGKTERVNLTIPSKN